MRFHNRATFVVAVCLLLQVLLLPSCASAPAAGRTVLPAPLPPSNEIHSMAFSADGSTLYYAVGGGRCEVRALDVAERTSQAFYSLGFCPDRLSTFEDGSVLAVSSRASAWIGADGGTLFEGRTMLAAMDGTHLLERTGDGLVWIDSETSVTLEIPDLRSARFTSGGVLLAVESRPEGERIVRFDGPSASGLTPFFPEIDSWDVAPRGEELVFSAKVDSSFDVGIVSVSGGEIRWVAPDPSDQRNVTWAPRGNKISYTFQSLDATLVRSVHVPTSFQVVFDLPLSTVRQVAWEPRAERFALVIESPKSGPRIDWVGYQGEERSTLLAADEGFDSSVEARFWNDGSGVLLGPETVRYEQKLATVVWIDDGDLFAWKPEVERLRSHGLTVLLTTSDRVGDLKSALDEVPWLSAPRLYLIDLTGKAGAAAKGLELAAWLTVRNEGAPEGAVMLDGSRALVGAEAVSILLEREGKDR